MQATLKISPEAREVLGRATITADSLTLPQQLDRKLYLEISKLLEMAGGKWNRILKAHLFSRDPREVLGLAVTKGEVLDEKKSLQFFETPPDLAKRMVDLAEPKIIDDALEPSAGMGAIAREMRPRVGALKCVEIHPPFAKAMTEGGLCDAVHLGDFLNLTPALIGVFQTIVMNPPFHGGADVDHITHAFKFLTRRGRLVTLTAPSWEFRKGEKWEAFRALVDRFAVYREDVPAGTFSDSGTDIRTKLIVLRRPG
jgi:hypothetical protein